MYNFSFTEMIPFVRFIETSLAIVVFASQVLSGTWMHWTFEAWLNRIPVPEESAEMRMFLQFIRSLDGLTAFRTEWMIYSEPLRLAGSIDFVAKDQNGDLVIFDWKRSKGLRGKYSSPWRQMTGPLSRLDDCAGMHYRLQLNAYKYILESCYDCRIVGMYVVCTHPDNGDEAFVDKVPVMSAEVDALVEYQRSRVWENACLTYNDLLSDPFGGGGDQEARPKRRRLARKTSETQDNTAATPPRGEPSEAGPSGHNTGDASASGVAMRDLNSQGDTGAGLGALCQDLSPASLPAPEGDSDRPGEPVVSPAGPDNADDRPRSRSMSPLCFSASPPAHAGPSHGGGRASGLSASPPALAGPSHGGGRASDAARPPTQDSVPASAGVPPPSTSSTGLSTLMSNLFEQGTRIEREAARDVVVSEDIPTSIQRVWAQVQEAHPEWDPAVQKLAVAALSVYQLRLIDMDLRVHVLLTHIVEGGRHMRAHAGACYLYQNGSWRPFKGVIPEATMARIKKFTLQLEGFYRLVSPDTPRTDNSILQAWSRPCA